MKLNSLNLGILLVSAAVVAGTLWLAWPKLMDSQLWTGFWAWSLARAGCTPVPAGNTWVRVAAGAIDVVRIA